MQVEKIETLVQQFQNRTLPKKAWTHEAHLAVAIWHLNRYAKAEATCLLRAGIINYNIAAGTENTATGGYHETITLFWIWIIYSFLIENKGLKINELISLFLASEYARKEILFKYYTKELLFSVEARANWVMPDLKVLRLKK